MSRVALIALFCFIAYPSALVSADFLGEGIAVVKEGASVVSEKMGKLTAEGKRQYKMFDLKTKIQSQMTVLGGRAYDVLDSKKSPAADSKIKAVFAKIKKLEE